MNRLQQTLETQRTRRASTVLYGYYTTNADPAQQIYSTPNVIATTDASDWYVHVFYNRRLVDEQGSLNEHIFGNSGFGTGSPTKGLWLGLANFGASFIRFHQFDTAGTNITLFADSGAAILGLMTTTFTYNGTTNHYQIFINGILSAERFGTDGVFAAGMPGDEGDMCLLKNDIQPVRRVGSSSIFSISAGNSVPTSGQILDMHQRTFRDRVAAKADEADHQWNLATYPTAPATLPDNTTGAAADMTLQGGAPLNRQFRWNYGKYN